MADKVYLYPVWVRLWHMANALLCLFLIITGISMQYSDPAYPIIRFDLAVSFHNVCGILMTISYIGFITGNLLTKNGKYYKLRFRGLTDQLKKQFLYYTVGIFKGRKAPFEINEYRKFNPLQKVSYVTVMYLLVPIIFITGLALLFPGIIIERVFGLSGIFLTDIFHILMGFLITIFLFIHIYFCTIGATATSNFKGMVTGYHESHD